MKRVIIESPYAGDIAKNVAYAEAACSDSLARGEAPLAGHLFYTKFLDDTNPPEREIGLQCDFAWMAVCDLVAVYDDNGVSAGMKAGIEVARELGIPVEFRKLMGVGV